MLRARRSPDPAHRRKGVALVWGLVASAGLHAALAVVLTITHAALPPGRSAATRPLAVELLPALADPPPTVEVPRARPPVPRPAAPEIAEPSPERLEAPRFVPHDVPPRLMNGAEILSALAEGVPEGLQEASVRGLVTLWLFVDESGAVTKLRLQGSSGFEALDALASRVARRMEYRPALHQGRRVAVWVSQPIRFLPDSVSRTRPRGQAGSAFGWAIPISGCATGSSHLCPERASIRSAASGPHVPAR